MTQQSFQAILIRNNGEQLYFAEGADVGLALRELFCQATGTVAKNATNPRPSHRGAPEPTEPQCPEHQTSRPSSKAPGTLYCTGPGNSPNGHCTWTHGKPKSNGRREH